MTGLDFLYGLLVLIAIVIMFISWLGTKYDIVGRDKERQKVENEKMKLQLELKKYEDREKRRKNRKQRKKEVKDAKK